MVVARGCGEGGHEKVLFDRCKVSGKQGEQVLRSAVPRFAHT